MAEDEYATPLKNQFSSFACAAGIPLGHQHLGLFKLQSQRRNVFQPLSN